jgi:hypothetical protein
MDRHPLVGTHPLGYGRLPHRAPPENRAEEVARQIEDLLSPAVRQALSRKDVERRLGRKSSLDQRAEGREADCQHRTT